MGCIGSTNKPISQLIQKQKKSLLFLKSSYLNFFFQNKRLGHKFRENRKEEDKAFNNIVQLLWKLSRQDFSIIFYDNNQVQSQLKIIRQARNLSKVQNLRFPEIYGIICQGELIKEESLGIRKKDGIYIFSMKKGVLRNFGNALEYIDQYFNFKSNTQSYIILDEKLIIPEQIRKKIKVRIYKNNLEQILHQILTYTIQKHDIIPISEVSDLQNIPLIQSEISKTNQFFNPISSQTLQQKQLTDINNQSKHKITQQTLSVSSQNPIEDYTQKINKNPNNPDNYYLRAIQYIKTLNNHQAKVDLMKCIRIDQKHWKAYLQLGHLYHNTNQLSNAYTNYTKSIELNKQNYEGYSKRGKLYYDYGRNEDALNQYNKSIEINKQYAPVYLNRAILRYNKKQFKLSEEDLNKSIQIDPKYTIAYNNRGNLYDQMKQYKQAEQNYNKALQIDPKYSAAYHNKGQLLLKLNRPQQALLCFNTALSFKPNQILYNYGKGLALKKLKKYQQSEMLFKRCIQREGKFWRAYGQMGQIREQRGQFQEALLEYNKMINRFPNLAEGYLYRGVLLQYLDRVQEAESDYDIIFNSDAKYHNFYLKEIYRRTNNLRKNNEE